jgi:hypothetical protein
MNSSLPLPAPLAASNGAQQKIIARRLRFHRDVLCAAVAVVALAFLLEVHADQRVAFRFLPDFPLPETCPSRTLLHVDCPGCGLTRSFVHLAHGAWRASWNIQHAGMLVAFAVILQIPYRIAALRAPLGLPLGTTFPRLFGALIVVFLLVVWLMNLIARCLS